MFISASPSSGRSWLQVDFLEPHVITGVLTQGLPDADKWVTQYALSFSLDGLTFTPYSDKPNGPARLFRGNTDRDSIVKHMLGKSVEARYVRIIVIESSLQGTGLRFNLIGCFG